MVTAGGPVFMLVIAVPAVLLMTAGTWFISIALISATILLGRRVLVGGVTVLPGAHSDRFPTCRLPLLGEEAAVYHLEMLHLELPHHVRLERKGKDTSW